MDNIARKFYNARAESLLTLHRAKLSLQVLYDKSLRDNRKKMKYSSALRLARKVMGAGMRIVQGRYLDEIMVARNERRGERGGKV